MGICSSSTLFASIFQGNGKKEYYLVLEGDGGDINLRKEGSLENNCLRALERELRNY